MKHTEELQDHELSEYQLEEMYEEHLDEVYGEVSIAGYTYSTSSALKEVDPTAFRCGFADWLDSVVREGAVFELDNKYYSEDPTNFEAEEETV